eukprot:3251582-Prorocentrum_lima.AAC.1
MDRIDLRDILQSGENTCPWLPPRLRQQFRQLLGEVCHALNEAIAQDRTRDGERLETLLLALPHLLLR